MTHDILILLGRDTPHARETLAIHAQRLRSRGVAEEVRDVYYECEPQRDLRDNLASIDQAADRVYAVPMVAAHTRETTEDVPAALSRLRTTVQYCEPVGRSPLITAALRDRATEAVADSRSRSTTLALVALGSSSLPYHRQAAEYHAARLRNESFFEEVVTSYLVQSPAVECLDYGLTTDRTIAVPFFVNENKATNRDIPDRLGLDREDLAYASSLGTHPRTTDAIEGQLARRRVFSGDNADGAPFEDSLVEDGTTLAADGRGQ